MLLATAEMFAQYGLVGLMVGAIFAAIAWAGQRLLGKDGVLELHAKALDRVADCVDAQGRDGEAHAGICAQTGDRVAKIHSAANLCLSEIEDECRLRGIDIKARCDRVRDALRG